MRKVGAAASRLCRCVVPVRGSPAMTTGGASSMSWISGCRDNRSVSSNLFFSHCNSWAWKLTMPASCNAGNILQRSEIHIEAFAVVVGAEIVEPGLGGGLGMQHIGVERAIRGHRSHHLPQRFGIG